MVNFNRNSPENNEAVHQAAKDTGIRLVSGVAASTDSPSPEAVIASIEAQVIEPDHVFGRFTNRQIARFFSQRAEKGFSRHGRDIQLHIGREQLAETLQQRARQILIKPPVHDLSSCGNAHDQPQRFG